MIDKYSDEGKKRLQIIDRATNFTNWMYSEIKPYLHGNILEIGSGFGTYSQKVVRDFKDCSITFSDLDQKQVQNLKEQFESNSNVSIVKLDLSSSRDAEKMNKKADSIFCLNVLEHIEDDTAAIANAYKLLNKNGKFIILVPAHKFLYNSLDRNDNHFRRYTKRDLTQKISKTGFKIKKMFYFNFPSIFGWYLVGNILKKITINNNEMSSLDKLVPIFRFLERYILMKKAGISLIAVLEKD